mmetsp:Transcript_47426/g.133868  ORF Transcript_47426/g.133868 Transcript_47426/m.133868 type:complete len:212 (+) Transcript_47426:733-1368(+)
MESVRTAFKRSVAPSHSRFRQSILAPCFIALFMAGTGVFDSFCRMDWLEAFGSSSLMRFIISLMYSSDPCAAVQSRREIASIGLSLSISLSISSFIVEVPALSGGHWRDTGGLSNRFKPSEGTETTWRSRGCWYESLLRDDGPPPRTLRLVVSRPLPASARLPLGVKPPVLRNVPSSLSPGRRVEVRVPAVPPKSMDLRVLWNSWLPDGLP